MRSQILVAFATAVLCASSAAQEVTVVVDHRDNRSATAAFEFARVPRPSRNDAATAVRFMLVDGERDANSAELTALHDGLVPSRRDEPAANFFFAAGSDGGRIVVDLRKLVDVDHVTTHSWHPRDRGPQVYALFASDGTGEGFVRRPKRDVDPTANGWVHVADVDTRTAAGGGGQFGVAIRRDGAPLGRFRYLLFDVRRTEDRDGFGNTFFSEIDVVDHDATVAAEPATVAEPPAAAAAPTVVEPFVVAPNDPHANELTDTERAAGWRLLFNGKDFTGWHEFRREGVRPGWQVADGAMICADPHDAGDIVTAETFEWFELELDYAISPGGNSGIMFHVTNDGPAAWASGPEFQLEDNARAADPVRCGWLYALYQPADDPATGRPLDATKPAGQWNHVRLVIAPDRCEHAINGVTYFTYRLGSDEFRERVARSKFRSMPAFAKSGSGSIALQGDHGQIRFRNVKIRPIAVGGR